VSEVCVRKTGILTTEDMLVDRFYMQNTDHPNSRKDTLLNCTLAQDQTDLLAKSIIFNSTVYIEMTRDSLYEPLGNSTEVSLFKWLQGADVPVHKIIQ
jgi:magnesium-transporting ATPase (P-type)